MYNKTSLDTTVVYITGKGLFLQGIFLLLVMLIDRNCVLTMLDIYHLLDYSQTNY